MIENIVWLRRVAETGGPRTIRKGAGLSVTEVARELGVEPSTVWRWEEGLRKPRGDRAERYAALLRRLSR